MAGNLMQDIVAKAQGRLKGKVFELAAGSKTEIDSIGAVIAQRFGGFVSSAGLKSDERASAKVAADYGGDWLAIKDLARMTIIVPDNSGRQAKLMAVLGEIRKEFSASKGRGIIDVKIVDPSQDPCGYSSITVFVKVQDRPAEIQINTPEMIFAKQGEKTVQRILGDSLFMKIKMKYNLDGGLGHCFYEIFRANLPGAAEAAAASKDYYQYFRRMTPDYNEGKRLRGVIDSFRRSQPGIFMRDH